VGSVGYPLAAVKQKKIIPISSATTRNYVEKTTIVEEAKPRNIITQRSGNDRAYFFSIYFY
jgi:hypothetical protein